MISTVTRRREQRRRVPHEAGSHSSFNLYSELYPSRSPAAAFQLGRVAMDWADPSESESSTQLNSSNGSRLTNDLVKFPTLDSEDLIRLGEDLVHVYPMYYLVRYRPRRDDEYVSSISNMIPRGEISPTDLSSVEATTLSGMFRKVHLPYQIPSQCLTPLLVRPYPDGVTRVTVRTRGLDF